MPDIFEIAPCTLILDLWGINEADNTRNKVYTKTINPSSCAVLSINRNLSAKLNNLINPVRELIFLLLILKSRQIRLIEQLS